MTENQIQEASVFSPDEGTLTRFWSKVDKPPTGCWLWKGARDKKTGYGRFRYPGGSYAHRFALQLTLGRPIKEGFDAAHVCHNLSFCTLTGPACPHTACVKHLDEEEHWQNIRDRVTAAVAPPLCNTSTTVTFAPSWRERQLQAMTDAIVRDGIERRSLQAKEEEARKAREAADPVAEERRWELRRYRPPKPVHPPGDDYEDPRGWYLSPLFWDPTKRNQARGEPA